MTTQSLAQPKPRKPSGDHKAKVLTFHKPKRKKVTAGHTRKQPRRNNDLPAPVKGHEWRVDGAGWTLWHVWRELDPRTGKRTRKRRQYASYCSRDALQVLQEENYETGTDG